MAYFIYDTRTGKPVNPLCNNQAMLQNSFLITNTSGKYDQIMIKCNWDVS